MSNSKFFYGGYGIKGYREPENNKKFTMECCGKKLYSKHCPECGSQGIKKESQNKEYPRMGSIIPDEKVDDFMETFDVLYPEGHVANLKENEIYIVLLECSIDKNYDWHVKKIDPADKDKLQDKLKPYMQFFKDIIRLEEPELITAFYGEW